ncbi:MAG TPA: hypothetical protein VMN78_00765 [Longimicrobiales bacterium]|nr:hypothetical protein [Longimicrobiales bacterium]
MNAARNAVLALLLAASSAAAQEPLTVVPEPVDLSPVLSVGPILGQAALADALRSGLPVRMHFGVELWRDELLDDLVDGAEFVIVLRYEPIARRYEVFDSRRAATIGFYSSYAGMRAAIETSYAVGIRPRGRGRYYYLASLEVETLALSDLDELQGWLRGELTPAVGGGGSILGAIGNGAKRVFIRVLGLPARRVEARSPPFRIR